MLVVPAPKVLTAPKVLVALKVFVVPKVPGAPKEIGAPRVSQKRITASSSLEIPLIPASSGAVLPRPKRKVLARCRGAVAKQSTAFGATRGQLDNASLCLDNASVVTL